MRQTQEAYIRGLTQGYALAKAQYSLHRTVTADNKCSGCGASLENLVYTNYCPCCGAALQN